MDQDNRLIYKNPFSRGTPEAREESLRIVKDAVDWKKAQTQNVDTIQDVSDLEIPATENLYVVNKAIDWKKIRQENLSIIDNIIDSQKSKQGKAEGKRTTDSKAKKNNP